MLRKVSRYDEHPSKFDAYHQVIGRSSSPTELPLVSELNGQSPSRIIIPLVILFIVVTQACASFAPEMFLGWLTHTLCFLVLGGIVYHLCPPDWTRRTEVNKDEVIFEYLDLTGYQVIRVPLAQYRGIIPIVHNGIDTSGLPYKEYGVALRHADPTKTIILSLSPLKQEQAVEHFSKLLKVKALHEKKFALELKSKTQRLQNQQNPKHSSI